VQFFVVDQPSLPPALIEPLAQQFRQQDLAIAPLIQRILRSQLFFSDLVLAHKIRSPVELTLGLLRALEITTNVYPLADATASLGQRLFYPPNVKGWDGGRTWINSATLLERANLVRSILDDEKTRFARGDLSALLEKYGIEGDEQTVDWLIQLLLAVEVPPAVRGKLVGLLTEGNEDRDRRLARVVHALSALPEFQLS
jgi:hypothetical protein